MLRSAIDGLKVFYGISCGQTVQMNAGIYNRATLMLLPRFTPDTAIRLMDQKNITIFAGVPTMYWAILNYPDAQKYGLQKIANTPRLCISGGAPMPAEVRSGDLRS